MLESQTIRLAPGNEGPSPSLQWPPGNDCRLEINRWQDIHVSCRCGENVMDHRTSRYTDTAQNIGNLFPTGLFAALTVAALAMPLSACSDGSATAVQRTTFVHTEIVR